MKKYLTVSVLSVLVLMPVLALAQLPVPAITNAPGTTLTEIQNLIAKVAQFLMVAGVVLALIFIIWGGIRWMSAGSDETAIKNAKTRMWQGVVGALIVLAVGLILNSLAGVVTRVFFGT